MNRYGEPGTRGHKIKNGSSVSSESNWGEAYKQVTKRKKVC